MGTGRDNLCNISVWLTVGFAAVHLYTYSKMLDLPRTLRVQTSLAEQ